MWAPMDPEDLWVADDDWARLARLRAPSEEEPETGAGMRKWISGHQPEAQIGQRPTSHEDGS